MPSRCAKCVGARRRSFHKCEGCGRVGRDYYYYPNIVKAMAAGPLNHGPGSAADRVVKAK